MAEQSTVRVGERGTIVVPARIRRRMGLHTDSRLLLTDEGDRLVLQPIRSFTDGLDGLTQGCFGGSRKAVEAAIDQDREDR